MRRRLGVAQRSLERIAAKIALESSPCSIYTWRIGNVTRYRIDSGIRSSFLGDAKLANIILRGRELGSRPRLPDACIVCGAEGSRLKKNRFQISQSVGSRTTLVRSMDTHIPLCDEHTNYFMIRAIYLFCCFAPFILCVLGIILVSTIFGMTRPSGMGYVMGIGVTCAVISIIGGGIGAFMISMQSVRASDIEQGRLSLANVADEFASGVKKIRDGRGEPIEADDDGDDYDDYDDYDEEYEERRRQRQRDADDEFEDTFGGGRRSRRRDDYDDDYDDRRPRDDYDEDDRRSSRRREDDYDDDRGKSRRRDDDYDDDRPRKRRGKDDFWD